MVCCTCLTFLWFFLLYKILDYLIRIPMRSAPTSLVNNIMITGCDSGFGRLFALRMDRKGFRVFASCLTEKGKDDLERASGSGRLKAFIMDVRSTESIEGAYKLVESCLSPGEGTCFVWDFIFIQFCFWVALLVFIVYTKLSRWYHVGDTKF